MDLRRKRRHPSPTETVIARLRLLFAGGCATACSEVEKARLMSFKRQLCFCVDNAARRQDTRRRALSHRPTAAGSQSAPAHAALDHPSAVAGVQLAVGRVHRTDSNSRSDVSRLRTIVSVRTFDRFCCCLPLQLYFRFKLGYRAKSIKKTLLTYLLIVGDATKATNFKTFYETALLRYMSVKRIRLFRSHITPSIA